MNLTFTTKNGHPSWLWVWAILLCPLAGYAQGFTDVSATAGINVQHDGSTTDVVEFSSGAAWLDYNRDGHLDLYVTMRTQGNLLYRNNGNGTFTDVAAQLGAADASGDGGGVSIADFNNDGWPDIYLANAEEDVLLRNDGGTSFTDITSGSGLEVSLASRTMTGSWGDYDDDGYVDLYLSQHIPTGGNGAANATQRDFLFHNNRNETFTDVSSLLDTLHLQGYGAIGGWTDFDLDGDLDILLVNDCDPSSSDPNERIGTKLFRNDGGGIPSDWAFEEVALFSGINDCRAGRGLAIGDHNRDGWPDYFYTNTGDCVLYENNGNSSLTDVSSTSGINGQTSTHSSWGTSFWDYDNDGWQDLNVAMGAEGGLGAGLALANQVYHNNGDGTFTEVATSLGLADSRKTRNIVYGDYDNDGDLDAFVVNYGEGCSLMRNELDNDNHYLKVDLVGNTSNRDGIGAQLTVLTPDGVSRFFETRSGSNLGGGDATTAHFGLGTQSTVQRLTIRWPSGTEQVLENFPANDHLTITENNVNSFTDVSFISGVDLIHDGVSFPDMTVGSGAAWFDYNRDGLLDLYVTMRTAANLLYENNGDGTFTEKAQALGAEDAGGNGAGVAIADFNNDGWPDIFIANGERDVLLKNLNGTAFEDISSSSGIWASGNSRGTSASWGDYDNDGYLDLYVSHHVPLDLNDPTATNQDFLFYNNGDETFTDVSHLLTIDPHLLGYGFIGGWTDYDNDGDLDILLVNDCFFTPPGNTPLVTATKLFQNDGGSDPLNWDFSEVSPQMGINDCRNGMGLAVGDFNRDGFMDYSYTNIGPIVLFENMDGLGFDNVTNSAGIGGQATEYWSWGTSFWDYDNDGWQDLIVSMGPMSVLPNAIPHPNLLFRNNGDGTFNEVGEDMNLNDPRRTRTMVHGDYDNDGDQDMYVVNYGQQTALMRNDYETGNHYLKIALVGTQSNRDGIGAKLKIIDSNGATQYFETRSGSNLGGGDEINPYFGLGSATGITRLEITWPSGTEQVLENLAVDQLLTITEPNNVTLQVAIKAFLEGPLDGSLMIDALRAQGLLPTSEPFTALGMSHVHEGGGEVIADPAGVLGLEGENAIADWIFVELRSKTDPTAIVATRSALLQCDGDIVDLDGTSPLSFGNLTADNYYLVLRHRNHFGVRTLQTVALSETAGPTIDFSDPSLATFGTNAQNTVGGLRALIAGDANLDGQVNAVDKNSHWRTQNGQSYNYGTSRADFNLDGAINAVDKNNYWRPNNSKTEQLD
ncbi:MAG: FG-GAP-like repeat-containing protein [Bacteroidota bacterium]